MRGSVDDLVVELEDEEDGHDVERGLLRVEPLRDGQDGRGRHRHRHEHELPRLLHQQQQRRPPRRHRGGLRLLCVARREELRLANLRLLELRHHLGCDEYEEHKVHEVVERVHVLEGVGDVVCVHLLDGREQPHHGQDLAGHDQD